MKNLYAYCDESGNTGLLNNDPNQPYLTYSAVIAESDLDLQPIPEIEAVVKLISLNHIHSKNIARERLPQCWTLLKPALERLNLRFFSCFINKDDFSKLKLFDMFFDSGLNERVSKFHYGVRANRLPLALNFIQTIKVEKSREFWTHNLSGNFVKMHETIANIYADFQAFDGLDKRTKELIGDALDYYLANPVVFHESLMTEFSSPNIGGFSLLLQTLHEHYGDQDFRISEVKHDIQEEFSAQLSELFNTNGRWEFKRGHMSLISDMKKSVLMPPNIVFSQSKKSNGIQLVDFLSYLMQLFNKGKLLKIPEFESFLDWTEKNGWETGVSTHHLVKEVTAIIQALSRKKMSAEDLEKGQKLLKQIEEKRKTGA